MKDYKNRARTVKVEVTKAQPHYVPEINSGFELMSQNQKLTKVTSKIVKTHPYLTSVETWRQQRKREVM